MSNPIEVPCDGCGQFASPNHMARRLQRLEWSTRYRPVHINALFLGGFSPQEDRDFLYSPAWEFHGEAGWLLKALGIETAGKAAEAVHAEFQRAGFFLTHVLECPLENISDNRTNEAELLAERLKPLAARIRRSLKPKRVVLISQALGTVLESIQALNLGSPLLLDSHRPYAFEASLSEAAAALLRERISGPV